jgi:hypothetical protein
MRKSYEQFLTDHKLVPGDCGIVYKAPGVEISRRVVLPCWCGEDICEGWAFVRPEPDEIAEHFRHDGART